MRQIYDDWCADLTVEAEELGVDLPLDLSLFRAYYDDHMTPCEALERFLHEVLNR